MPIRPMTAYLGLLLMQIPKNPHGNMIFLMQMELQLLVKRQEIDKYDECN